jgi:hypothetical protein
MVIGLPHAGQSAALPLIAQIWHENILSLGRLHSGLTDTKLALMSMKTTQGIYIGLLVNESILGFPRAMRIILLVSFLLTVFLILFLLLNIRQDNMTVIQNRIKKLQINLIKEYYEHKGDFDWNRWRKELEQRRKELHAELKRGLKTKGKGKSRAGEGAEIDALIDKSWNEHLPVIGGGNGGTERKADIDEGKLKALVDQYLLTAPGQAHPPKLPKEQINEAPEISISEEREKIDKPEALEELGEMEELPIEDEPEEIEELPADEPETLEELEELEPMEGTPKTRELDPSELAESEEGAGKVNPASTIEFSPPSAEIEKQKDVAAKSMAEKFKIQSPFPVIFSGLAEEDEPAELLSLEEGVPEPEAEPLATEVKPLNMYFVKPLLSVPFSTALNSEIDVLAVQDIDDNDDAIPELENTVIAKRDGVPYINKQVLKDKKTIKNLDPNFKHLVESVLSND